MLHPSYTDLMAVVNSEVEPGEQPVVQSRYSIVLATAKEQDRLLTVRKHLFLQGEESLYHLQLMNYTIQKLKLSETM